MKLDLKPTLKRFLRSIQRAYARALRTGPARVPHEDTRGPLGGSLANEVLRKDLVQTTRTSATFLPTRLGLKFRLWWNGSKHQRARGRDVPIDEDALVRALEEDLAEQVRALDQRSS